MLQNIDGSVRARISGNLQSAPLSGLFRAAAVLPPDRIGCAGLSFGGFYSTFTAAADTRIRAVYASCCLVNTVRMTKNDWKWQNSGLTFQEYAVAALIAPRAICFDAGSNDEILGSGMSREQYAAAKPFFEAQDCPDNIMLYCHEGNHEVMQTDGGIDFLFDYL